jgi:hypothetical protein
MASLGTVTFISEANRLLLNIIFNVKKNVETIPVHVAISSMKSQ